MSEEEIVEGWSIGNLYPESLSPEEKEELDAKAEAYIENHPLYKQMDEVSKAEVREFTRAWVVVCALIKDAYDNKRPLNLDVEQARTLAVAMVALRHIPEEDEEED